MVLSAGKDGVPRAESMRGDYGILPKSKPESARKPSTATSSEPEEFGSAYTLKDALVEAGKLIFAPIVTTKFIRTIFRCLAGSPECRMGELSVKTPTDGVWEKAKSSDLKKAAPYSGDDEPKKTGAPRAEWSLDEISMLPANEMLSALELLNIGTPAAHNRVDEMMRKYLA